MGARELARPIEDVYKQHVNVSCLS
uniref:Uncharacterized protein n=1 Tax=Arundo donax TaxID=35708 RepID=A0A0A9EEG4_ARUDO